MRKVLPAVLSGFMAASFGQMAAAQPEQAGATVIQQRGTQNSTQVGDGNQSTQVYGNENQTTTQSGTQEQQSSAGSSDRQSRDNRRANKAAQGNKGLHKGWEKKGDR